jgi:competence protein ComGC
MSSSTDHNDNKKLSSLALAIPKQSHSIFAVHVMLIFLHSIDILLIICCAKIVKKKVEIRQNKCKTSADVMQEINCV